MEQSQEAEGGLISKVTTGVPQNLADARSISARKPNDEANAATNITTLSGLAKRGLIVVGKCTQSECNESLLPRLPQTRRPMKRKLEEEMKLASPRLARVGKQSNGQKQRMSPRAKQWRRCKCGRLYRVWTGHCACANATALPKQTLQSTTKTRIKALKLHQHTLLIREKTGRGPCTEANALKKDSQETIQHRLIVTFSPIAKQDVDNDTQSRSCTNKDLAITTILEPHGAYPEPCKRSTAELLTKKDTSKASTRQQQSNIIPIETFQKRMTVSPEIANWLLTETKTTTTTSGAQKLLPEP